MRRCGAQRDPKSQKFSSNRSALLRLWGQALLHTTTIHPFFHLSLEKKSRTLFDGIRERNVKRRGADIADRVEERLAKRAGLLGDGHLGRRSRCKREKGKRNGKDV